MANITKDLNVHYDKRHHVYELPDKNIVKYAICSVSGGMDSATCLFHAKKIYGEENVKAISIYYGQKHDIELQKAREMCKKLNVELIECNVEKIFSYNKNSSALLKGSQKEIEMGKSYSEIMGEKIDRGEVPISDEYIPNRNSLFMNIICSIGLQKFNSKPFAIITGVHSDDNIKQNGSNIGAYPDTSIEFVTSLNKTLQFATAGLAFVYAPLVKKSKTMVAVFGVDNGMTKDDFNATWSCYNGGTNKQCGQCATCKDRINSLIKSGIYNTICDITEHYKLNEEEAAKFFDKE